MLAATDAAFEYWWKHYPRKQAKQAARREFVKALNAATYEQLLAAVREYEKATDEWPDEQKEFIPQPRKWLYDHRWDDDRSTWYKSKRLTVASAYALVAEARRQNRQYTGHSGTVYSKDGLKRLPEAVRKVAAECWDEMGRSNDPREVFARNWRANK